MIYLLLSILSSTSIVLIFKSFDRFKVNTFQAIVVNYLVAATLGFTLAPTAPKVGHMVQQPWFIMALFLGTLFIVVFNTMARTAQKVSVTASALANNLSTLIPIVAAFFLYGDEVAPAKLIGIIVALGGMYFALKKSSTQKATKGYAYLPFVLFFGSGLIGVLINYTEKRLLSGTDESFFIPSIFVIAFCYGVSIITYRLLTKKTTFHLRNVVAGLLLGIPNYFSIFFLIRSLQIEGLQSSQIWPMNNIGVVLLSAVMAMLIFRERLSLINWIGMGLATGGILLLAFYQSLSF